MNVNVTETTTGVQISENPAGLASGVLTGSYPNPALNYGAVDHLSMTRSSYRMFSDFSTMGDWKSYTFAGGTSELIYQYDGSTLNYVRCTIGTTQAGSRVWITDRTSQTVQGHLNAGRYEMVFAARVKLTTLGETGTICRIGFVPAHVAGTASLPLGTGEDQGIHFWRINGSSWIATSLAPGAGGTPPVGTQVDTGAAVSGWHVLKITVNAAATEANFYVDDVLAMTVTNPAHIPTDVNNPSTGSYLFAGALIRNNDIPQQPLYLDIDWMYTEYKIAR